MSIKTLYVYNSPKLFEILDEIKSYLNMEVYYIDDKSSKNTYLEESENNIVISNNHISRIDLMELESIDNDLSYLAPELLDKLWIDVYTVLANKIPLIPESPIYVTHVYSIYNSTTRNLINLDHDIH